MRIDGRFFFQYEDFQMGKQIRQLPRSGQLDDTPTDNTDIVNPRQFASVQNIPNPPPTASTS